jgi:hypothetical protein
MSRAKTMKDCSQIVEVRTLDFYKLLYTIMQRRKRMKVHLKCICVSLEFSIHVYTNKVFNY